MFIQRQYRPRFRESLGSKRREKLLSRLQHFEHLDSCYLTQVSSSHQNSVWLHGQLRARGAPLLCYIVSNDPDLDCVTTDLEAALDLVTPSSLGSFISCVPGQLAYFHGESIDDRYMLQRPND